MDVFEGRTKVPLEQGTIYKLRIAAVNSCGQSDWSEVNKMIARADIKIEICKFM